MLSRYEHDFYREEGAANPLDINSHWTWDNPLNVLALFVIVILLVSILA